MTREEKKMRLSENKNADRYKGLDIPKFEGHVKFRLWNPRTHKTEAYFEGKNLVTNAVADIFARNLNGGLNYTDLLPIVRSYFGGVLVYQNQHTLDADNYFPEDDSVNPLVAHAGANAPGLLSNEDWGRGSPVSTTATSSSLTQVWEWTTEQGNLHGGLISALSLTHKDTGDAGLGNTSSTFAAFDPYLDLSNLTSIGIGGAAVETSNNIFGQYDDRNGFLFLIGDDGEYTPTNSRFATSKITVYIVPLAYTKVGLWDKNIPTYDFVTKFTVTISVTFYGLPAFYFDQANKKLWLFSNKTDTTNGFSQTVCNYSVIDCVSKTEDTHGTITSDDNDLGIISLDGVFGQARARTTNIVKDGNYVFLPLGTSLTATQVNDGIANYKGLKKIDITNQSDQTLYLNNDDQVRTKPYHLNGGLILNCNRVFNAGVGYTCTNNYFIENEATNPIIDFWAIHSPDKASSLAYPVRTHNTASTQPRRLLLSKMLNTTLFNLPSSVTKTSTTAMQVEYTISEV